MDNFSYSILPFGDNAIVLNFENVVSRVLNRYIHDFHHTLNENPIHGYLSSIPAYTTLTIVFDKDLINPEQFRKAVREIKPATDTITKANKISIPVCYEAEYSLDMDEVCRLCSLSKEEVIAIHTSAVYDVYMMGFQPGFAYLGLVDDRIMVPRKNKPRQIIFRNAVGLAGIQTGIYPSESSAGWQIIGCAAIDVFNIHAKDPFLIHNGDQIEFYSISKYEYEKMNIILP